LKVVGEKQRVRTKRSSLKLRTETESSRVLARGSNSMVGKRNRVNTPVSAFQMPESTRASELDVTLRRPAPPDNGRVYLFAIIGLLLCVVAVLVVLLLFI